MKPILNFLKDHITLIIALATAYIYFCVYGYETSFLKAFNIPSNYATIDLNTILLDGYHIIFVLVLIGFGYYLAWTAVAALEKKPKVARMIKYSWLLIMSIIGTVLIGNSSRLTEKYGFYLFLIGEFLIVALSLSIPIKKQKLRFLTDDNTAVDKRDEDLNHLIKGIKWASFFVFLFTFFLLDQFASGQAHHQSEFQIVESTNYVVVRKYGDQLICVDFDTVKKIIGSRIIIIKLNNDNPVKLITKNLGHIADIYGQLENYNVAEKDKNKKATKP